MTILEDTRQQESRHRIKHDYFSSVGIMWVRTCLYCGDYTLPTNQSVCIDTKKDIGELIGDINVRVAGKKEIERFVDEICSIFCLQADFSKKIYDAICDEDSERFAEKEISDLCHKYNACGMITNVRVMGKNGKSSKCIYEMYTKLIEQKRQEELFIDSVKSQFGGNVTITKSNISVVDAFQELYVKRHGFFHRGLKRAQNNGIKLYILVENKDGIKKIEDLFRWNNPRLHRYNKINYMHSIGKWLHIPLPKGKPTSGETLAKALLTMQLKYGVIFDFCKTEDAGRRVIELLGGE